MNTQYDAQELWACLALQHTEGLGPKTAKQLLQHYTTARTALGDAANWPRHKLARPQIAQAVVHEHYASGAEAAWELIQKKGLRVLLYADPLYPEPLRQIPDPPLFLFYDGRLDILLRPALAMVGSRSCSRYGLQAAADIALELSNAGLCIVSGFALGIDRQSHIWALKGTGKTIAVLGTGPDLVYPARNRDLRENMRQTGLILTEFPPGTPPDPHNFPRRNRIISGLSFGVLIIEAAEQSGSLITARLALEQNREVFALPGPLHLPTYSGCHALIRQGALLVRNAADILEELAPMLNHGSNPPAADSNQGTKNGLPHDLTPDEQNLARTLTEHPNSHIDALTQKLGWESKQVSQTLLMLELKGLVQRRSGMYYVLK